MWVCKDTFHTGHQKCHRHRTNGQCEVVPNLLAASLTNSLQNLIDVEVIEKIEWEGDKRDR